MTSNRDYSDIIDLERPVSKKHPPMSLEASAALTGLDEMMDETAENERDRVANELMHEKYEDG